MVLNRVVELALLIALALTGMEMRAEMIAKMIGYRGWKVWMSYDMQISLLAVLYIALLHGADMRHSLILLSSLGFYFMYGFLVNDFCDMPYDLAAGKKRAVQEISREKFMIIIIAVSIICVLHLLYLENLLYIVIYTTSYLLATFYSSPPIRFKERGFIGILVCALIEKALPVLAIFAFFSHLGFEAFIFFAASLIVHMSEIMTHQMHDYESDMKTGTRTFVVASCRERALSALNLIYLLSAAFMILLCALICVIQYAGALVVIVFVLYVVLHLLISKGKLSREEEIYPLYLACLHFLIFNAFPVFLSFIGVLRSFSYIPIAIFAIFTQYYTLKNIFNIVRWRIISRGELTDT